LIDGTPVLDIKPYIPYSDSVEASSGYALAPEPSMLVEFREQARARLVEEEKRSGQPLGKIIRDMLSFDPRPAYQAGTGQETEYGMRLFDYNVRFRVEGNRITVVRLDDVSD
jgi:hypothetical protein